MSVRRFVISALVAVGICGCGVVAPEFTVEREDGTEAYVYGCEVFDEPPTIDVDLTDWGYAGQDQAVVQEWMSLVVADNPLSADPESYTILLQRSGGKYAINEYVEFEERDDDEKWLRFPVVSDRRIPKRLLAAGDNRCVDISYLPSMSDLDCGLTYEAVVTAADCPQ